MASGIDSTKPVAGNASTSNVRANFSAAETEINELHRATEDSVTAGGTADALTADFVTDVVLAEGITIVVLAASANATTTPTLNVDGTGAKTIVKGNGIALVAGDIAGTRHYLVLRFDNTNSVWALINPEGSPDADKLAGVAAASYARKDQANTFTEDQTIKDAGSATALNIDADTGFDTFIQFKENGVLRGRLQYDESADILNIRKFDTDGSTIKTSLELKNNGDVEVTTGNLVASTQSIGDNSTKVATTEYVQQEFDGAQQSKAQNGFQKLPGGIIFQWGRQTIAANTADVVITYPIAFPNATFMTTANYADNGLSTDDNFSLGATAPTTTTMRVTNGTPSSQLVHWFAVGH